MDNDDRITGQWTDENGETFDVHFGKVWRGHEWSDEEAQKLMNGETVEVELTSKAGNPYKMNCKLAHQSFTNSEGKAIHGIWVNGEFAPRKVEIPDEFLHYMFTPEEKEKLKNGETIHVDNLISKKGTSFAANLKWGDKTYKGHKFKGMIMSFD